MIRMVGTGEASKNMLRRRNRKSQQRVSYFDKLSIKNGARQEQGYLLDESRLKRDF